MLISRLDSIVRGKNSCTVSHVCSIKLTRPTGWQDRLLV